MPGARAHPRFRRLDTAVARRRTSRSQRRRPARPAGPRACRASHATASPGNRPPLAEHIIFAFSSPYVPNRFLIESNRQREKTKVQRLKEYKRLKEIEAKLAAERQKETRITAGKTPVRTNLSSPAVTGKARTKAAATVGLSENTAEKGLAVLNLAESGGKEAQKA